MGSGTGFGVSGSRSGGGGVRGGGGSGGRRDSFSSDSEAFSPTEVGVRVVVCRWAAGGAVEEGSEED